jgi:hypothetical protein
MNGVNERTLRDEGLIDGRELPSDYSAFIEGLSTEEFQMLVNLKQRAEDAGIQVAPFFLGMPIL